MKINVYIIKYKNEWKEKSKRKNVYNVQIDHCYWSGHGENVKRKNVSDWKNILEICIYRK